MAQQSNERKNMTNFQAHIRLAYQDRRLTTTAATAGYHGANAAVQAQPTPPTAPTIPPHHLTPHIAGHMVQVAISDTTAKLASTAKVTVIKTPPPKTTQWEATAKSGPLPYLLTRPEGQLQLQSIPHSTSTITT
jgi:hypothetical protein